MNVGILTHYTVNNQGAQLQLYALYNYIKELGCDVYVETYKKNYDFDSPDIEKRNEISAKSLPYIIREFLIKKGPRLTWHNYLKYKTNTSFRKKNFRFCHYSADHVDTAVIGSDEVFSLQYGVNIMMYGHAVNADKLISYAPSFGQTDMKRIEDKHCAELIIGGLKMFDSLSVRDEHTYDIVSALTGKKNIQLVCDPVLLYDFSKVHTPYRKLKKKYLILYSYDRYFNSADEIEAVRSYARLNGLKVASVGTYHKWCDYNVVCDPLQWIEYFRDAEAVVTNTFHGTILSIITNTPMAVISQQPKVKSILYNLGLSERNMTDINCLSDIMSKEIDFDAMNGKWAELRKRSTEYLQSALMPREKQAYEK